MVDMTLASIDFSMSGKGQAGVGGGMTLAQAQQLAVKSGYVKTGDTSKPLAQRADLQAMFKAFNVNSLSSFRQLFYTSSLDKSGRVLSSSGGVAADNNASKTNGASSVATANFEIPDVSQYDTISSGWDATTMKWRMIQKPGGAHMKPTDFYRLYAAQQQAENGDCTTEQPMWAEHGGLDFDGRERWAEYNKLKGTSKEEAKKLFCAVYGEAMHFKERNFRKF